ncbi:MAG: YcxB family protein, partial [Verrucomicrobiota bacterium]
VWFRRNRVKLWLFALIVSVIHSLISPPSATVNGEDSLTIMIILMVFVQIPVVAILAYWIARLILGSWMRGKSVGRISNFPEDYWGERYLSVESGQVMHRGNLHESRFSVSLITRVVETRSSILLMMGGSPLFIVPRQAVNSEELYSLLPDATIERL